AGVARRDPAPTEARDARRGADPMSVIAGVGARIATGLDALGAATSIRARKSFVRESPFIDHAGEAIGLALVASIGDTVIGRDRFVALGAPALAEAAAGQTQP